MPNVDEVAKKWEEGLSKRVGEAIQKRRTALGLTAQQLAERTRGLGYLVSRVAISKIEGNKRAGKLDVAELLVLAVALEVPPALLLYSSFPDDGVVELLPGYNAWPPAVIRWLCGESPLPMQVHADDTTGDVNPANAGTELVGAFARLTQLRAELRKARFDAAGIDAASTPETAQSAKLLILDQEAQLVAVKREIANHQAVLWGTSAEDSSDG
jgi:transcriptional regulator with XRE-family HTH domain